MYSGINLVYVNGEYLKPEQATVSVFDRGFIFGDGIYEVIPAYGGKAFRWPEHILRLSKNLETVSIDNPLSEQQWQAMFQRLINAASGKDQYLYLQVSRGVAPRDHAFPSGVSPTVFAYAQELSAVALDLISNGVSVVTLPDNRWRRCDIKTISLISNVWLRQQAVAQDKTEAILIRDGLVTEGAATNVFAVINEVVLTAPNGPDLLPGITRDLVIELLQRHKISYMEQPFSEQDMCTQASEVWLTSSTKEIIPVTNINDQTVGNGRPGPVFNQMLDLFQDYKQECRDGRYA